MSDIPEEANFDPDEWEEYDCEEDHGFIFWVKRYFLALLAVAFCGAFFWFLDYHKNRHKRAEEEKEREQAIKETVLRISRRESLQTSQQSSRRGSAARDAHSAPTVAQVTPRLTAERHDDVSNVARSFEAPKPPLPRSLEHSGADIVIGDDRLNVSSNIYFNSDEVDLPSGHLAEVTVSASVEVTGQDSPSQTSPENSALEALDNAVSGEISDFQDQNVHITVNLPPVLSERDHHAAFTFSPKEEENSETTHLTLESPNLVTSSQESGFLEISTEGSEMTESTIQLPPESSHLLQQHSEDQTFPLPHPTDLLHGFKAEKTENRSETAVSRTENTDDSQHEKDADASASATINLEKNLRIQQEIDDSTISGLQDISDEPTETFTISLQKSPEESKILRKSSDFQTPDEEFPPTQETVQNYQENAAADAFAERRVDATGEENNTEQGQLQKSPETSRLLSRPPGGKEDAEGPSTEQNLETGQVEHKSKEAQFLQKAPAASKILLKQSGQKPPEETDESAAIKDSEKLQKKPETSKILLRSAQKTEHVEEASEATTESAMASSKIDQFESDLILSNPAVSKVDKVEHLANQDSFDSADFDAVSVKVPGRKEDQASTHSRSEKETESVVSGGSSLLSLLGATDTDDALTKVTTLAEVSAVMREAGLQSSNLIFGIDYTASNKYQGEESFDGFSLHSIRKGILNPYQQVISIVGKTLMPFASSGQIPAFGFGDAKTSDWSVFPLKPDGYAKSFDELLRVYTKITPKVILSGPTNFAPLIYQSIEICKEVQDGDDAGARPVAFDSRKRAMHSRIERWMMITSSCHARVELLEYHILVIVADGQVTNERATRRAIVDACKHPLSIIVVGVGDGPWDQMRVFDDSLPKRPWDNFHFVEFEKVVEGKDKQDVAFALESLMEIPDQYKLIKKLGLLDEQS